MTNREVLISIALKYDGDYNKMLKAIEDRECIDNNVELPPLNSNAVTLLDEDYPGWLKKFYKPPIVLFYHGDLSLISNPDKNLSVIGTRKHGKYGESITKKIVQEVDNEVNIVSGLARGIDSIAHTQALLDGRKTIAVLGSGINYCYPEENKELYEQIKKHGLIISEYPDMTPPTQEKFPFRNRLIAYCSKAILITEAYPRSGTSITAAIGLDIGRDVCCVPHPAGKNSFCNTLIANGAFLVESGKDILDIMNVPDDQPIFEK